MNPSRQKLTFLAQGRWYACDLLWVREILRQPRVTPVDRAPDAVFGLINLRGQILTALDLNRRLGLQGPQSSISNRCIVFKSAPDMSRLAHRPEDAASAGTDLVGIIVDEIGDILDSTEIPLPPPPETLSGLHSDCIAGVLPRPEGLTTLLNVGALISVPTTA